MELFRFDDFNAVTFVSFLRRFKRACDSIGVSEGVAKRLLLFFTFKYSAASLTISLTAKKKIVVPAIVHRWIKVQDRIISYVGASNFLLNAYATNDDVAKDALEIKSFKRLPNQTIVQLAKIFDDEAPRCEDASPSNNPRVRLWRGYPWFCKTKCAWDWQRALRYTSGSWHSMWTPSCYQEVTNRHLQQRLNHYRVVVTVNVIVFKTQFKIAEVDDMKRSMRSLLNWCYLSPIRKRAQVVELNMWLGRRYIHRVQIQDVTTCVWRVTTWLTSTFSQSTRKGCLPFVRRAETYIVPEYQKTIPPSLKERQKHDFCKSDQDVENQYKSGARTASPQGMI